RRQFVKIFVERIARINAVLDSIKAGNPHCRRRDIRIRGSVGRAKVNSLRFWTGGISRDANGGGAIAGGIGEIDRRFESRDEAFETVRGRIRDAGERGGVLQNPANKEERRLA